MRYFLGVDIGGTKTHTVIADENGNVLGFGHSGPGNHQGVGYEGMLSVLQTGFAQALQTAGLDASQIAGAGFGIAGYDWPSEKLKMEQTVRRMGLACPLGLVNDCIPGLVAGASDGWGVVVVSGTGCNCRGWDASHKREGRVTGYGYHLGEHAGSSELVWKAMQRVAFEWTKRGPATALTPALVEYAGAKNLEDLIEGYTELRYQIGAPAARIIFDVAAGGDQVARDLIRWAGVELGEMANGVIRQLGFEKLEFDVVLSGGMFDGGPMLVDPMRKTINALAPRARLVRLTVPPVLGAVMIGMEQAGVKATSAIRARLEASIGSLAQQESNGRA